MNTADFFAGDRIDYMNARRDVIRSRGVAAGGKNYAVIRNARAEHERDATLSDLDRIREEACARFADIRAAMREDINRIRSGLTGADICF